MTDDTPYDPNDLVRWYEVKAKIANLTAQEMELRQRIFKHHFPTPEEGVNHATLGDGYQLNGTYVINRKVDEAALVTLTPNLHAAGIVVDDMFRVKRELAVKEYRKIESDKAKLVLVDQCLIIKPGAPQLEIVLPKRR
jgi:hypothetical protein